MVEEENVFYDLDLVNMIVECEWLNIKKNEYGWVEKKQLDFIVKWFVDCDFDVVVVVVGEDVYDFIYKFGEVVIIDLDLFLKLVGQEIFMIIVLVMQGVVKKQVGDMIYFKVKQIEEIKVKFLMKKCKQMVERGMFYCLWGLIVECVWYCWIGWKV